MKNIHLNFSMLFCLIINFYRISNNNTFHHYYYYYVNNALWSKMGQLLPFQIPIIHLAIAWKKGRRVKYSHKECAQVASIPIFCTHKSSPLWSVVQASHQHLPILYWYVKCQVVPIHAPANRGLLEKIGDHCLCVFGICMHKQRVNSRLTSLTLARRFFFLLQNACITKKKNTNISMVMFWSTAKEYTVQYYLCHSYITYVYIYSLLPLVLWPQLNRAKNRWLIIRLLSIFATSSTVCLSVPSVVFVWIELDLFLLHHRYASHHSGWHAEQTHGTLANCCLVYLK